MEEAIAALDDPEDKKPPFFTSGTTRLRILKGEAALRPGENQTPEIWRAKLWNFHGEIFLEQQHWEIREPKIHTSFIHVGSAAHMAKKKVADAFAPLPNLKPNDPANQLLTTHLTGKIIQALKPSGKKTTPAESLETKMSTGNEPFVVYSPLMLIQCFELFGHRSPKTNNIHITTETKTGSRATIHWALKPLPCQLIRSTGRTPGATQIKNLTNLKARRIIPVETLITMIQEQSSWMEWPLNTVPKDLDLENATKTYHPSRTFQNIYENVGRKQNPAWKTAVVNAAKEDSRALMLSSCANPKTLARFTKKFQSNGDFNPILSGIIGAGLCNQTLLTHLFLTSP
jgi:hypothetical protein